MDAQQVECIVKAAVEAALANSRGEAQSLRRPDLPPFDKDHIEIWILRMEQAYTRCNIRDAKTKFAFLDKTFHASADPCINDFLLGPQTEDQWTAFLAYLREQHGRTKRVQAYSIINGTPREGRRPSQLLSLIKEKAGKITLNDVMKELVLKELPQEVQRQIAYQVQDLTAEEMVKVADTHFDKQGKMLHPDKSTTSVNSIQQQRPAFKQNEPTAAFASAAAAATSSMASFTVPFNQNEDETDVNAIRFKQGQKQSFNIQNRGSSRGRGSFSSGNSRNRTNGPSRGFNSSSNPSSSSNTSSSSNSRGDAKLCKYHNNYGNKAENCESFCILWPSHSASKGKASH